MSTTSNRTLRPHGKLNPSSFIIFCVRAVFSDKILHGRWLPAEQLHVYMHMKCNVGDDIKFSSASMMRAMNKALPLASMLPNKFEIPGGLSVNVFRHSFQIQKRRHFFWVTSIAGAVPSTPSNGNSTSWEQDCVLTRLLSDRRGVNGLQRPIPEMESREEPERKRRKSTLLEQVLEEEGKTQDNKSTSVENIENDVEAFPQQHHVSGSWWQSGDARRLFAPCDTLVYDSDCDVKRIVMERIELLEAVNHASHSWKTVVDHRKRDASRSISYSEGDVFSLRFRSMYLAIALKQFVANVTGDMRTQWSWKRCLMYAIRAMNDVGIEFYSSFATLAHWHRKLARNRHFFYSAPEPKTAYPPFFRDNPDAMEAFKKHGVANLKDLSVELMFDYVHNNLIPRLMVKRRHENACLFDDDGCNQNDGVVLGVTTTDEVVTPTTRDEFLQAYGLSKLCVTTVARWMHACGFKYRKREKHYFVDGHQRPETMAYRPVFTKRYLDLEIRAHRWLQITLEKSKELEASKKLAIDCGYNYVTDEGVAMVEYHIDTSICTFFDEQLCQLPLGGNLSVRKPIGTNVVMFMGQDEAIFKQFLFHSKMWVGPGGERPLLPKDEGIGTMISAFICREHGLTRRVSEQVLDEVNFQRQGKQYADKEAAIEILGSANKSPLTSDNSPFLVFFEYGENREGYWAYNNMVVQFEDAVDVLKVMHPAVDFVFLFDHSSGHSKRRPDGLNQHRMNRLFGGKNAASMRNTIIEHEQGYLGAFPRILEPGDTQSLVFNESDSGPFWMTALEKEETRHEKRCGTATNINLKTPELILTLNDNGISNTEGKTARQLKELCAQHGIPTFKTIANAVDRSRSELELELRGRGINTRGRNKRELIGLCEQHNIETSKIVEKIKEGWEGNPKGLAQVLWERGLIDGTNLKHYSLTGKKDELGVLDITTSLKHIMGMCHDFLNEEGMLQHIANCLGVKVMLTPKCHAELAGEGIEYLWGQAKGTYRSLSLNQKKGKDIFKKSIQYCLSDEVITRDRVRKFSRRARQYLMAYHAYDTNQVDEQTQHDCTMYGPVAVDKLINEFKTHRCALDFDYKFVMGT